MKVSFVYVVHPLSSRTDRCTPPEEHRPGTGKPRVWRNLRRALYLGIYLALLAGCHLLDPTGLLSPGEVSFVIPMEGYLREFPLSWEVVSWNGERFSTVSIQTAPGATDFTVDVVLPPGGSEGVFLCAIPTVTLSGVVLRPMGGWVFPPDEEGRGTVAGGVLASKLLALAESGVTVACINVDRIHQRIVEVLSRGDRVIDPERLEEGIRSGAPRSYHVRGLEEEVVTVQELIPSGGIADLRRWGWYTDDQNDPRCEGVVAGEYIVWSVPVGSDASRSLWRYDPLSPKSNGRLQRLVVHRSLDGHSRHHVFPVPTSQRN